VKESVLFRVVVLSYKRQAFLFDSDDRIGTLSIDTPPESRGGCFPFWLCAVISTYYDSAIQFPITYFQAQLVPPFRSATTKSDRLLIGGIL
jgi:hypothetical protein